MGGLVIELVVGATVTTLERFLPYTAAAMLAGDTSGGGMPQIPRGVSALPYPAAIAAIAAAIIGCRPHHRASRRDLTYLTRTSGYRVSPNALARKSRVAANESASACSW